MTHGNGDQAVVDPPADIRPSRLRVVDVHKSFRGRPVLRGIDLTVEPGRLTGLIGEPGAGKTTLLRVLAGEIHADQGHTVASGTLGYCPQRVVMDDDLTVEQHLRFFRRAHRVGSLDRAAELCARLGVRTHLHTCVGLLSRTVRQRLNVILSLIHEPDIVLFDEPHHGFDRANLRIFWEIVDTIRENGGSVIITGDRVRESARFDHLFDLVSGRLCPR